MMTTRGIVLLMSVASATGCRVAPRDDGPAMPGLTHDLVRARTSTEFENSVLYKPREDPDSGPAFQLAPIVVQELEPGVTEPVADQRIGTWRAYLSGARQVDPSHATVYFDESSAILNGRERRQITYAWWQVGPTDAKHASTWQAVRMTPDDDGFPQIWEVLGDERHAVIYVSQSLERGAERAFGNALPNRRYAIEPSIDEQPQVFVARVLSDGPVAMGPFVYQSQEPPRITTVLCRCMNSQIAETVAGVWYDIKPLSALEGQSSGGIDLPSSVYDLPVPLADMHDPTWLQRALRLPPDF